MVGMIGREERRLGAGEDRFAAYLDEIVSALGHASRDEPARAYCTGLLLPGERKSVEPMAARLDPERVQARHQSMHHIVAQAAWDDAAVLGAVRRAVIPAIERHGPLAYWIVDDTAFPKQGTHSVGVARQYCGVLGKQENCQVAVSLSVANDQASLPIAYQLYLPEAWAADPIRRAKAGVPEEIAFATKTAIALDQIRQAQAAGVPEGIVLGMPAMVTRPSSGSVSQSWACLTCWVCALEPASGCPGRPLCRLRPGRAGAGHRPGCGVAPSISRLWSKRWPSACPSALGAL